MNYAIEARSLFKNLAGKNRLQQISLNIRKGAVLGLLGINGAGKTTLLQILSGQLYPDSGELFIHGLDALRYPRKIRSFIGAPFENPPLYDELRVEEFLNMIAGLKGLFGRSRRQEVEQVLAQGRLKVLRKKLLSQLSKGYRQRLALASSFIGSPSIIFLDEPSASLDPAHARELRQRIASDTGKTTFIFSSHILSEVEELSSEVAFLHNGKILDHFKLDAERSSLLPPQSSHAQGSFSQGKKTPASTPNPQNAEPYKVFEIKLSFLPAHSENSIKTEAAEDAAFNIAYQRLQSLFAKASFPSFTADNLNSEASQTEISAAEEKLKKLIQNAQAVNLSYTKFPEPALTKRYQLKILLTEEDRPAKKAEPKRNATKASEKNLKQQPSHVSKNSTSLPVSSNTYAYAYAYTYAYVQDLGWAIAEYFRGYGFKLGSFLAQAEQPSLEEAFLQSLQNFDPDLAPNEYAKQPKERS